MRRRPRPALIAPLMLVLALVAGCASGAPTGTATTPPASVVPNPDASLAAAAATARLDPCPVSTSTGAVNQLPDVTLECLGDQGATPVRLAGLSGPTVVNVWGSWCGPCRDEAPLLQRLQVTTGARLAVLGIDYEDADVPALAFAAEQGLHYPSVTDPDGAFPLRRFAVGPPVTLFVDAAGAVVHVQRGPFRSWDELRALVADRLGVSL